ncbi:cytochrome P450 [Lindgomyces ingoldianus]|uniref:Cytochrome P450 n=1 Tax=Lindgomyces ingoldianus TaxID=673940 RepID=A0ACB6R3U7_9PLEO|nr:cytochrome P450 [Lindgomyces ingoldianus]KAF2473732.1 cytochrome P450 [Lindgomyces ingoldianus]
MGNPETDPGPSSLLGEKINGEPISKEKLIWGSRLPRGRHGRPPILFGNICAHLARDKALQYQLHSNASLIPAAIEEFVRLYVPYRGFCRTASCPVTLHGRTINPNEPITMTYAAANRDPNVFKDPHEFILGRENVTLHLGFGRGRHRCAGMPLARMALQIGLRVILDTTKDFDISGELEHAKMPEMGISHPNSSLLVINNIGIISIFIRMSEFGLALWSGSFAYFVRTGLHSNTKHSIYNAKLLTSPLFEAETYDQTDQQETTVLHSHCFRCLDETTPRRRDVMLIGEA